MKRIVAVLCCLWFFGIGGKAFGQEVSDQTIEETKRAVVTMLDVVPGKKDRLLGSGFFIDSAGYVLTAYHVLFEARDDAKREFWAETYDGRLIKLRYITREVKYDLALMLVCEEFGNDFPYLRLSPDNYPDTSGGDLSQVASIGHNIGSLWLSQKSVVLEVLEAPGFLVDNIYEKYWPQISFGFSGGPLINFKGEVIGVNLRMDRILSLELEGPKLRRQKRYGYAIVNERIKEFLEKNGFRVD